MKKKLASIVIVGLLFSSVAFADTVSITSNTIFSTPGHMLTSSENYAFRGTKDIVFTVAGKTCTLRGSARGSVPMGCNYAISVTPNGSVVGHLTAGNQVCTQSNQIETSCK